MEARASTRVHRACRPVGPRHRRLLAPLRASGAGAPTDGPSLGDKRAWTTNNQTETPSAQAEAERAAARELDLWLSGTSNVEQLTLQVRTRWLLQDIHHIMNGTGTMADIIFDHRGGRHSPSPTIEHPSHWRYVATRLMAHMGAYTPGDLDRLNWRCIHRAALRIQEPLIRHNVWTIQTLRPLGPPAPDRARGYQRPRSPMTRGPPRQVASTSHSQSPQGQPPAKAPR